MKKFLSIFLCVAMLLTMAAFVAADEGGAASGGSADFDTITTSNANGGDSGYSKKYTTAAGWTTENCAIQIGGSAVSNPAFPVIGADNTSKAVCLNGKVSAPGKVTSPTLTGGITKLTINYTKMFTDTKLAFTITLTDLTTNATYTHTVTKEANKDTKYEVWTDEWTLETPITGDFTMVIVNDCPTAATGNKDRATLLDVIWEGNTAPEATEPEATEPEATEPEGFYKPAHGDQVTIYYPDGKNYITATVNGKKLAGGANGVVLTVSVDANGYYTFTDTNGKALTSGSTGNSLSLADASNLSLWELESAENGWYIKSVNAKYSGKAQYIEFYDGFTTYGFNTAKVNIYTFQFEKQTAVDPTPSEPEATEPEATEPTPSEPADGSNTTVTTVIGDYADANGWENSKLYDTITMDSVITVTASGTATGSYGLNTGKYYTSGENWRIYQSENANVTITAKDGTIVSVKITYVSQNTGVLTLNGENIESDAIVSVNADSVTFGIGNTGTATNGQARITSIEVVYSSTGSTEPSEPEATEPEATEPEATEPEATEPEATEPEATEPVAPEYGKVTELKEGVAYKFGMTQANLENAVYYLAGGMDGYYMATTTDIANAIDVYVEATEGGYHFYTIVEGAKTYINMVVSGTHVNGAYEATASTVYRFENGTLVSDVDGAPYWFGTRNDKTYTTMGPCKTEYAGFFGEFYGALNTSPNTGDTISVVIAALFVSAMGTVALVSKKKEF